jgi:hypothetical protein
LTRKKKTFPYHDLRKDLEEAQIFHRESSLVLLESFRLLLPGKAFHCFADWENAYCPQMSAHGNFAILDLFVTFLVEAAPLLEGDLDDILR